MEQIDGGRIFFFDGPDWVGKTTQVLAANDSLQQAGYDVVTLRSHGGTEIGEALREVSLNKDLPRPVETDLFITLAIHAALSQQAAIYREQGKVMLIDRSPLSTWAYQVYGDRLDSEMAAAAIDHDFASYGAELTIVYNASLATLHARKAARADTKSDYFDSKDDQFFSRVIEGYDFAAKRYGAAIIDASRSLEAVTASTMVFIHDKI